MFRKCGGIISSQCISSRGKFELKFRVCDTACIVCHVDLQQTQSHSCGTSLYTDATIHKVIT
jgi:hypothetical protein